MSDTPIRSKLKPHISATALDDHRRCARRTYYRFVAQEWVEQSESLPMAIGNAVHAALKRFYAAPTQRRSLDDLHAALRSVWRGHNVRRFFADRDQERHAGVGVLDMLERFHAREDVAAVPIAMEQKLQLHFGRHATLFGRVDRIDATPDGIEIVDYKTGRPFDDDDLPDETALMVYAAAAQARYDMPVVRVRVVNLRDGTEAHWDLEEDDLASVQDRLGALLLEMHRDDAWPANPGPACRVCRWATICDQRTST